MLRSMLLAAILLVPACAAAPAEEGGSSANAITTGASVRSRIAPGVYDTDEGFLAIAEDADRLHVSAVFELYDGTTVHQLTDCEADLDVHLLDDGTTVDGGKDCALTLAKTATGLHVTGRVSGIGDGYAADYVLRTASALVGTYAGSVGGTDVTFTASSATAKGISYALRAGTAHSGTASFLAGAEARNLDVSDAFGCSAVVEIRRHGGAFEASLVTGADAILDGSLDQRICTPDVQALDGALLQR